MEKNPRLPVFLCYARKDREFLDRVLEHLESYRVRNQVCAWSDKEIEPGSEWSDMIDNSIGNARAAVLLISHHFLGSDFIRSSEVPRLLQERQNRGLKILPLIVRPCPYEDAEFLYPDPETGPYSFYLNRIQSVNPDNVPLTKLPESEQDEVLTKLARTLHAIWKGTA